MAKIKYPLNKVYTLLGSGPVVLISSRAGGKNNIMPIAWTSMLDFDPPIVGCCIGDHSHTFKIVKKTKRFAINIPSYELIKKVMACGQVSGKTVDKFQEFGLTAKPASKIDAPLVDECFANLECEVVDTRLVKQYNFFIVKVVAAWMDGRKKTHKTLHHVSGKNFILGGKIVKA